MLNNERDDSGYWTPTKSQIFALESRLSSQVRKQNSSFAFLLPSYRRQYFGFIREGRAMIWIVGFCGSIDVDWRRELVSLPDTGGCYFEAQYDVGDDALLYVWQGAAERGFWNALEIVSWLAGFRRKG
jgi:hypothetical protein